MRAEADIDLVHEQTEAESRANSHSANGAILEAVQIITQRRRRKDKETIPSPLTEESAARVVAYGLHRFGRMILISSIILATSVVILAGVVYFELLGKP